MELVEYFQSFLIIPNTTTIPMKKEHCFIAFSIEKPCIQSNIILCLNGNLMEIWFFRNRERSFFWEKEKIFLDKEDK